MSGTLKYARSRLGRLATQLRYLPQTLALVREAAGHWVYSWVGLLIAQGLLPLATIYLTRAIVNSLILVIRFPGQSSTLRQTIVLAIWMGVVMLAAQILRGVTAWVRTAQAEMVKDHITALIQKKITRGGPGVLRLSRFLRSSASRPHGGHLPTN